MKKEKKNIIASPWLKRILERWGQCVRSRKRRGKVAVIRDAPWLRNRAKHSPRKSLPPGTTGYDWSRLRTLEFAQAPSLQVLPLLTLSLSLTHTQTLFHPRSIPSSCISPSMGACTGFTPWKGVDGGCVAGR